MVAAGLVRCAKAATRHHLFFHHKTHQATLGILSFEAAKTMCRLISIYKSLAHEEVLKLRREIVKSRGVTYLNSKQESFLLSLACNEHLEELDAAASTISRLGHKCSDFGLNRFDLVYEDLKLGIIDLRKLEFGTRNTQKKIEKMEKLVTATKNLHAAMETVAEMEASEKKVQVQRLKNVGKPNIDYFNDKLAFQRKQVHHYRAVSLWNQTFDKTVGLMARIVCIIFARIYSIFQPYISGLPFFSTKNNIHSVYLRPSFEQGKSSRTNYCLLNEKEKSLALQNRETKCDPISITTKTGMILFSDRRSISNDGGMGCSGQHSCCGDVCHTPKNNRVLRMASPSTVGGSGLALRYANVIIFAEQRLHGPATIGEDAREALYQMLPARIKMKMKLKLKSHWKKELKEELEDGQSLARGWRQAVEELMKWLSPVAHDTVRWHTERHFEKQKFDMKPRVLLLQTLHYSDIEKAEAAIVEVLVGLSCIYRYENCGNYIGREIR